MHTLFIQFIELISFHTWYMIVEALPPPTNGMRPHRKRKITQILKDMIDSRVCTDEGCEMEVDNSDLLRCDACKQVVSGSPLFLTQFEAHQYINSSSIT